jgi:monoterpene epsilon-lactone hydrolase
MTRTQGSAAARRAAAFLRRYCKPLLEKLIRRGRSAQRLYERIVPQPRAPFATEIAGDFIPAIGPRNGATLIYLHGGGYVIGSPRLFRFVSKLFARAGFDVFAPAYRLAPEHPFPAALDDAFRAYEALLAARQGPIVLAGDSAGGGLALSLMLRARDAGLPLPKAAALFSPWTDLAATGPSTRENEARDALFTRRLIVMGGRMVAGAANVRDPLLSPLYADLSGLPPLIVHAGRDEALRDDSTRLVERARAAGTESEIELWPDVPHGWQLVPLPEAKESRDRAIAFLKRPLSNA